MRPPSRTLALSCALLVAGCLSMGRNTRTFATPLTSAEGQLVVPALVSTAENMGLEAWGRDDAAQVRLEDGTRLQWWDQQGRFVLTIDPAVDGDGPMRQAKVRADQIWELAVQARQANNVGAVVVQPPRPRTSDQDDAPPPSSTYAPPPPAAAPMWAPPPPPARSRAGYPDGYACISGSDCNSGTCFRGRCGTGASSGSSFGHSGSTAGAQCSFSSDCASGNCRGGVCEGGAPGAPCTFSSDCPGNNCRNGRCEGGAAGAPCTFSSDCPSGSCNSGTCE